MMDHSSTLDADDSQLQMRVFADDPHAEERVARLEQLGLGASPDLRFDALAARFARQARAPFAMVNFRARGQQYFAGLYEPETVQGPAGAETATGLDREMDLDHGYCPHVIARTKALTLDDVCDYPRYAGNPVFDDLGVRSYQGTRIHDFDGLPLGTVCFVDTTPHNWGQRGLEVIKEFRREVEGEIHALSRH